MACVVQLDHVDALFLGEIEALVQFNFVLRPSLRGPAAPSIIHQNLPHELGRNRDKMSTIYRKRRPVAGKTEVDFVNKLRALQGMIGTLSPQTPVSGEPQLLIDERDQSLQCLLISTPPANEQLGTCLPPGVAC
jgi:hypothetical protein